MVKNSFRPLKWLIKSESQEKQVLRFLTDSSSFVPELMLKEFMDLSNASKDQRVLLMQELI